MAEEIRFEIGERYRNRLGWYEVLEIVGNQIKVRYENTGKEDTLDVEFQKRIIANIAQEEKRVDSIMGNRENFFFYLSQCNKYYRSGHDLDFYREIIAMHKDAKDFGSLIDEMTFCNLVHSTLEKWNMNQRRAKLSPVSNLRRSLMENRTDLVKVYKHKLHLLNSERMPPGLIDLLERLFCNLEVMDSKRRIVGVSKTLHFLLPDLVMPMDGKFTMLYFYGYNKFSNNIEGEFKTFKDIFMNTVEIASRLNLSEGDVDGVGWNTSIPKLIDNVIIGFFTHHSKISRGNGETSPLMR
jgi:hypothetical protein